LRLDSARLNSPEVADEPETKHRLDITETNELSDRDGRLAIRIHRHEELSRSWRVGHATLSGCEPGSHVFRGFGIGCGRWPCRNRLAEDLVRRDIVEQRLRCDSRFASFGGRSHADASAPLACPRIRSWRCPGKTWSGSHRSNCHHPPPDAAVPDRLISALRIPDFDPFTRRLAFLASHRR
jgi:hypothetical protein